MNTKKALSLFTLSLLVTFGAFTQTSTSYTIQLGAFEKQEINELLHLSEIANVYINPSNSAEKFDVVLGAFKDLTQANAVMSNLKNKNFDQAYVSPLPISKGKDVYVIQLEKVNASNQVNWNSLSSLGKVYSTIENGAYCLTTGIYPDYQSALPRQNELYQAGYTHAEVVKLNSIFLHEMNTSDIAFQEKISSKSYGKIEEFTAKGGGIIPNENPPAVNRVALAKSIAPGINRNIERESIRNLQAQLSNLGTFTAAPNGLYDDNTANAYYGAVQLDATLKTYTAKVEAKSNTSTGYFVDWNDIQLLLAITEDISGTAVSFGDAELKALIGLYKQPKVLSTEDTNTVNRWLTTQKNLLNSKNTNIKIAFELALTKSTILLEDYFLNKGFNINESTDLANASIYALLINNLK